LVTGGKEVELPSDIIRYALGMNYKICEHEHSYDFGGRVISWRFIDLLGQNIDTASFSSSQVANIFGTETGDVICASSDSGSSLLIDIGPADEKCGYDVSYRSYNVFPLW